MKQNLTQERSNVRIIALLVGVLCVTATSAAEAETEGVAIHQCVLVSASLDSIYLTGPNGELVAHNLETGARRWSSSEGVLPLGIMNGELLAQANAPKPGSLELVAISAADGRTMKRRSMSLPPSVHAAPLPGPGRVFSIKAGPREGGFQLVWHAMRPPMAARGAVGSKAVGNGQFSTGKVEVAMTASSLSAMPLKTGDDRATPARPMIREVNDVELEGAEGRKFTSADGRHLLVSQHQKGAQLDRAYRWSVYEMSSQALVGRTTSPVSVAPFVVTKSTLIYTTPEMSLREGSELRELAPSVRARDLAEGRELWSHEIRSMTVKGPFPH